MDHGGGGRAEAERWCSIAGKLLEARDLVGCKKFADRAMEADPLLDDVDQIVAAADVLLASQRRINNHLDWYAILQLQPSSDGPDLPTIKRAYRRLALLLHPDKNRFPSAAQAFKLVSEAWTFLCDPTKKHLYDGEIKTAAQLRSNGQETPGIRRVSPPPPPPAFWTMCPGCFRAFEYGKEYKDRTLRCQNCRKPFEAAELPNAPPVVPGTDTYYCSWGLFPLGFPGVPVFNGVVIPQGTPFIPTSPSNPLNPSGGEGAKPGIAEKTPPEKRNSAEPPKRSSERQRVASTAVRSIATRPRKVLAKRPKKQAATPSAQMEMLFGGEAEMDERNNNGGVQGVNAGDFGGGFDMNSFSIDLDATAQVLGNLANLPFLKDDEIVIMR